MILHEHGYDIIKKHSKKKLFRKFSECACLKKKLSCQANKIMTK